MATWKKTIGRGENAVTLKNVGSMSPIPMLMLSDNGGNVLVQTKAEVVEMRAALDEWLKLCEAAEATATATVTAPKKKAASRSSDVCPNCGGTEHEDNGMRPNSVGYTLLCVTRVKPKDRALTHVEPEPDQFDENGLVACGYQWSPNDG